MAEHLTTLTEGLLINFGFLALVVSAWTFGLSWILKPSDRVGTIAAAILFAGAVALLMEHSFIVGDGLRFDLRSVPLSLSGLFGGPVAGLATLGVAACLRLIAGGPAVPNAVASMVVVASLGIAGHVLLKGRPVRLRHVITLAALTASVSCVSILFLPHDVLATLPVGEFIVVILVLFATTSAIGAAIVGELRRREAESENRLYRAVIESLPEPIDAKDLDGRFLVANSAVAEILGVPDARVVIGKTFSDFISADQAKKLSENDAAAIAAGKPSVVEQYVVTSDGTARWLASLKAPLFDDHARIAGLITHNRDISDRKRLEAGQELARRQLDDAIASMADGLVIFDRDGRIALCNQRYRDFFPLTAHLRVPGTALEDILRASIAAGEYRLPPGEDKETWVRQVKTMLEAPSERLFELRDGRWIHSRMRPMSDGGALGVITDVTKSRRTEQRLAELNQRLEILARVDGLTGLTNRRAFEEVLAAELARSRRTGTSLGLLMLDIDNFKAYNDTYGHLAGDECLRRIAETLRSTLQRPGDLAARFGGEEFVAILPETDLAGTWARAEAVRQAGRNLAIPHATGGRGVVTVSIGVAVRSGSGSDTPLQLVGWADRALYAAKAAGRDRVATDEVVIVREPASDSDRAGLDPAPA